MGSLKRYILKRLLEGFVTLMGLTLITFFLARVAPSDPAALWVGLHARPEQVEQARKELGLDKPLYVQYLIYLRDLFRGNWGISYRTRRPVIEDVLTYLPATVELALAGLVIAIIIGVPLGVIAATKKDKMVDHACRLIGITTLSAPSFWLALLLQILFARMLGILPLQGRLSPDISEMYPIKHITGLYLIDSLLTGNFIAFQDALLHIILPAFALASYSLGFSIRMIRATMIEVLREKYIVAAEAFGIPKNKIRFKYALKNAIIPTLTILGIVFAWNLTGAYLVEMVFNWPGLGTYTWRAILAVDYPVIVATTTMAGIIMIITNLIIDLAQAYIDPRVRP
ncbi:ABC transporter permease [Candidatus Bathyarchaeota archaeon]|nr:MAG: ABC transporter permease [Candidatus Bathyarchaeota archaeon]